MTQGGKAVTSGNVLESTVEGTLQGHGYFQVGDNIPKKQRQDDLLSAGLLSRRYARQVYVGTGIYGTDLYVDFYIVGSQPFPAGLIVECKWQQTGGSVDEKLPYVNLNIQHCYPTPAIVVIDGGGMKSGAIAWLEAQVAVNPNLVGVYPLSSFIIWANQNL